MGHLFGQLTGQLVAARRGWMARGRRQIAAEARQLMPSCSYLVAGGVERLPVLCEPCGGRSDGKALTPTLSSAHRYAVTDERRVQRPH